MITFYWSSIASVCVEKIRYVFKWLMNGKLDRMGDYIYI